MEDEREVDDAAYAIAKNKAVEANIRILENFYSFLISFALTQATYRMLLVWQGSAEVGEVSKAGSTILYATFVFTLVPFYQGMNRFLYATHVVRPLEKPNARYSPLLFDIWAFLLMSSILFALGYYITDPVKFFYLWSALLLIDIVWTSLVWVIQGSRRPIWAVNNLIWLGLGWLYWVIVYGLSGIPAFDAKVLESLAFGFVFFEIGRTVFDYKINWEFYFPPEYRGK